MDIDKRVEEILENSAQKSDTRCGFQLRVRKDKLPEYLEAHAHVWPEMREALTRAGWRNYSLFVDQQTGMVFGYFEADDVWEAISNMEADPINARWQEEMAKFFAPDGGGTNYFLPQYFYLP